MSVTIPPPKPLYGRALVALLVLAGLYALGRVLEAQLIEYAMRILLLCGINAIVRLTSRDCASSSLASARNVSQVCRRRSVRRRDAIERRNDSTVVRERSRSIISAKRSSRQMKGEATFIPKRKVPIILKSINAIGR